nr:unnamed protein product [Callosobruchus analis]
MYQAVLYLAQLHCLLSTTPAVIIRGVNNMVRPTWEIIMIGNQQLLEDMNTEANVLDWKINQFHLPGTDAMRALASLKGFLSKSTKIDNTAVIVTHYYTCAGGFKALPQNPLDNLNIAIKNVNYAKNSALILNLYFTFRKPRLESQNAAFPY